MDKIVISDFPR